MAQISCSVSIPPLSDGFEQSLTIGSSNNSLLVNGEIFPGVQLPSKALELIGSSGGSSKWALEDDEDGGSGDVLE
jgi:hypothetical protein